MSKIRLSIRTEAVSLPPELQYDPCLERWQDLSGREYGFGVHKDGLHWMKFHNGGAFVVRSGCSEVTGFPDEGVDLWRFQDLFSHFVTPWILQRQQWDCLHASAVLKDSGVVAFCGPSGRGKSTIARAWRERGAVPYADDAVPFLVRNGAAFSASIPQRLRLREPAASHFRESQKSNRQRFSDHEILYDLETTLRPLSALYWLLPMFDAGEHPVCVIERMPSVQTFRLLLSEAHCMTLRDPACNRKMIRNYLSLVHVLPVFGLSFATGMDLIPAVLDRLEQHGRELQA